MQQILVIDDSKAIHTLVSSLLGDEPMTIHSAYDSKSGIVLAESLRPDLILLDVEMPDVDGYETCRRLRAKLETASVPIIFLTAKASTEELVRGLNLGANDYVTKPFKLSELLSRVNAALRTSRLIKILEEDAMIDPVTGLGNRAMFHERLAAEVELRIRCGNHLACYVLDVDGFKQINEKYGNAMGDYVLSQIAETVSENSRIEDVVCRYEKDQFVVLTPQTSAGDAALLAEVARAAVAKLEFSQHGKSFKLTCSIGVAQALHTYDRSIMERATEAMLKSLKAGGNRVSIDVTRAEPGAMAA